MNDYVFPMSVEEIEAWLEDHFAGTPQRVRVRELIHPDGTGTLTLTLRIDPAQMLIQLAPPPAQTMVTDMVLGEGPEGHAECPDAPEDLPQPSEACGEMTDDMAARIKLTLARAQLERALVALEVVTLRLPGPPEQQAEARSRVKAAREDVLVKEAELITEGFDRWR